MRSLFYRLSVVSLLGLLQACVSLQSVSLTQIPAKRSNQVTATASRMSFLGFNFDNDYVNSITDNLKSQCQNGQVQGILTKDEATAYFGPFLFKRTVTASGYCSKTT
jgi:hypothetical protein